MPFDNRGFTNRLLLVRERERQNADPPPEPTTNDWAVRHTVLPTFKPRVPKQPSIPEPTRPSTEVYSEYQPATSDVDRRLDRPPVATNEVIKETAPLSPAEQAERILEKVDTFLDGFTNDPNAVRIPRARFTVWRGDDLSDLNLSAANDGVNNVTIPSGQYVFTYKIAPAVATNLASFSITKPFPFTIGGKQAVMHGAKYNARTKEFQVHLEIVENLIPILLASTAALGALGFAGWGVSQSLYEVDRVLDKTWIIAGLAVLGVGAYIVLKRR